MSRNEANTFEQKWSMGQQKWKAVSIHFHDNSGKKVLPISIVAIIPAKDVEDVAIIGLNTYCLAC